MSEKSPIASFANEAEEAGWWFSHREENGKAMAEAMESKRTMKLSEVLERHAVDPQSTAIEVDPQDLARARQQAVSRGLAAEDYMRQLLHEALLRNDAA